MNKIESVDIISRKSDHAPSIFEDPEILKESFGVTNDKVEWMSMVRELIDEDAKHHSIWNLFRTLDLNAKFYDGNQLFMLNPVALDEGKHLLAKTYQFKESDEFPIDKFHSVYYAYSRPDNTNFYVRGVLREQDTI